MTDVNFDFNCGRITIIRMKYYMLFHLCDLIY